ncbi:hypothetical protein M513_08294 [Trichuris suis]|uniref:thioredoxin-dependent peroxiredoxin n=1 Tax=Trichuris suis TaxID=68888 RepID=A0A085M0W0_9BILA|nr:hypothetical protein M513_08294 [Trichuris suis]
MIVKLAFQAGRCARNAFNYSNLQAGRKLLPASTVALRFTHHKHESTDESQPAPPPTIPRPQDHAPNFKGQAVIGGAFKEIKLSDYKGKWLILFFYPLDFTFVCPTEIIAFSERSAEFKAINCELIACSTDSHFSHLGWIRTARKEGGLGEMKIPVMSDFGKTIARDYGVLLEKDGIALRGLFVIDPKGIVRHVCVNDLPVGRSVDEALRVVMAFQFVEKHGEVCPANWKPDSPTIKANPTEAKEYFSKVNKKMKRFASILATVGRRVSNKHVSWANFHCSSRLLDLSEFFDSPSNWDQQVVKTGRPWRKEELRIKSNSDLHKLWFVLLKERNMLLTMEHAAKVEVELFPCPERLDKVEISMKNLQEVVSERNRAYCLLTKGHTGERPWRWIVNEFGFRVKKYLNEHETPPKPGEEPFEEPYISDDAYVFQKLWKEKLYSDKREARDLELRNSRRHKFIYRY